MSMVLVDYCCIRFIGEMGSHRGTIWHSWYCLGTVDLTIDSTQFRIQTYWFGEQHDFTPPLTAK